MASTLTTFDALLFERYYKNRDFVETLMYGDNTLLGMLEKKGDSGMVGASLPIPIQYGNPQGGGGVFSTAQTNEGNTVWAQFSATAGDYYFVVNIGDKVMMASRNNNGAFLENKVAEVDGAYEQMGEDLSIYLWGNGGLALGRRSSISSDTVTLTERTDAANFEINMYVVASSGDGSSSSDSARSGSSYVTAVDVRNGTITLNDQSDISSFANGDWLFRQSAFAGDTSVQVMRGVQAFITSSDAPPALWGVTAATRLLQLSRLSGCRVPSTDLTGLSIQQRIKKLVANMKGPLKSKKPDCVFLNPLDCEKLDTALAAQGQRDLDNSSTKFGYESIRMRTGGGTVEIYEDRHCPIGTAFAFRMKNHWITSMGELIHPQREGSNMMLLRDSATDNEVRLISYPIYVNNAPLYHGRVPLYT